MDGRTTDNGPWHKLAGLWPVELKTMACLEKDKLFTTHQNFQLHPKWKQMQIVNCSKTLNVFQKLESISYQHFFLIPYCFQNLLSGRVVRSLPHDPKFWWPWKGSLLKTLWVQEKMLVNTTFSLFCNLLYSIQEEFLSLESHLNFHLKVTFTSDYPKFSQKRIKLQILEYNVNLFLHVYSF